MGDRLATIGAENWGCALWGEFGPHLTQWGSGTPQRGTPQFLAHVSCGQMAGWIKIQDATWY